MNFSLRDDKVVNRIEKWSSGLEKLHLSSVSLLKSDGACVCVCVVSEETECLSRVRHFRTDDLHQCPAITLIFVKQILASFSAVDFQTWPSGNVTNKCDPVNHHLLLHTHPHKQV